MADEKLENQLVEEDDFTFDIGKKPAEEKLVDEVKDENSIDEKPAEEIVKDEKSFEEKPEDKKSADEKPAAKTEEKPEDKPELKKEEVIDIFAVDDKPVNKKSGEVKTSYKPLATDLGIELENDTSEEFKAKVNQKIENAKQEFKLDGYSDEAKALVKHLKDNDGKVEDFLNNKDIISLQGVKNLDPEQKVLFVRTNELTRTGLSQDKAQEQAAMEVEEMSARDLKNRSNEIDTEADGLISKEIRKITGDREVFVAAEREKIVTKTKAEITQLKSYVSSQTEFFGIELSDKAKQSIIHDIESGVFDDIANKSPESSKFTAYMVRKFGKSIMDTLNKKSAEQNRTGYNAATEKSLNALHKTKEAAQQKQTGHQKSKTGETGKFDGFSDAIGEDE